MGNIGGILSHGTPDLTTFFFNTSYNLVGTDATMLVQFWQNSNNHVSVWWNQPDSKIRVFRGDAADTLLATSSLPMSPGVWHHVEMKLTIDNSVGVVQIYVDGVLFIDFSGDTQNGGSALINKFTFGDSTSTSNGDNKSVGEIFLFDASGSYWNDFMGNIACYPMPPTADAGTNQWTPSTGSDHYAMVDEVVPNDDTDYLSDSTNGNQDIFTPDSLPANIVSLEGVLLENVSRQTDVGGNQISNVLIVDVTETVASATGLSTNYQYSRNIFENNPDSASAWVLADWSDISFGVENVVP